MNFDLEPHALEYARTFKNLSPENADHCFNLSIAISLKRIADALHGTLESTGLLQYADEMSRQQRGH